MRALVIADGRLAVEERPAPTPPPGALLVAVEAAGLNRADLAQLAGHYPAPPGAPADIPGLEFAGTVVARGDGATRYAEGARVMALVAGGGQADLAVVDERHVLPVPDAIAWEEAGGFMEAFATAHDALHSQGALQAGERLLVQGAAGGVGVAGVQLGVAAGARVVATARSPASHERLEAFGASVVAPAGLEDAGPYDVILELVGGDNLARDVELLAPHGRLVVIGTGAGARAEIDFMRLMARRASVRGSTLRARSADDKADVVAALGETALRLLAAGTLSVPVHETFALDDAPAAYESFAAGGKFGKLVLTMGRVSGRASEAPASR